MLLASVRGALRHRTVVLEAVPTLMNIAQCSQRRTYIDETKALVLRNLLVDTLSMSRKFQDAGLSREQADELTKHITEVIILNKIKMEDTFVAKKEFEKVIMEQDSRVQLFKAELAKAQDNQAANVNKELERQQSFLDKMRTEVRHEIDKLTSSQRLDMNLEKGRMRDDLQGMRDKTTELEIKVDRDINELKSSVEKAKNDTIKSVITILGTFSAIAFTISRFMQMGAGGGG
uniref:Uncharacterized protein n=1 Tax=Chlamydomonas leiostraca TaxID=1034604 RepID=A0A7S0X0E3_9CHLO|mmetsp:Transcript_37433/g.94466  ORF Transcript_37433/g.94466 Transcript_37433/m.94466 type:complete len:232 (+) Transcript_37433:84-779(+)